MNHFVRYFFWFAIYFMLTSFNLENEAKSDLIALFKKYQTASSFSLLFEMKLSIDGTIDNGDQTFKGAVKMSDNLYFSSVMGKIVINNDKINVVIDENSQVILCSNGANVKNSKRSAATMMFNENLLDGYVIKYLTGTVLTRVIEAKNKSGIRTIYTINNETGLMSKYENVYDNNTSQGLSRVEITYTSSVLNNPVEKSAFDVSSYVKVSGKSVVGVGKYKGYRVINQMKQ